MKQSENIKTVLEILKNEVDGDIPSALAKMTEDYSMTWMYRGRKELFPSTGNDVEEEMGDVYVIKGRKYDIRNIAEGDGVVKLELIESYPDADTEKEYRTPLVIVLEMDGGRIRKGRHYCDPAISYEHLEKEKIEEGYKGTRSKMIID
jgi:ketosteroid isomerase-like protein